VSDRVERYARPADVVRDLLAAESHAAWGARTAAELAERARGLAAEAGRILTGANAAARRLRDEAEAVLTARPEWREAVNAALKRPAKERTNVPHKEPP